MKKIICVLLAAVFCAGLFSSCYTQNKNENSEGQSTNSETATAAPVMNTTQATSVQSETTTEYDRDANSFLGYLKTKDIENLRILLSVSDKNAFSFLKTTTIDHYSITAKKPITNGMQYSVKLTVSRSSSKLFPVGTSNWTLEIVPDGCGVVTLFCPADATLNRISDLGNGAVALCKRFSTVFRCYKTVSDLQQLVPDAGNTEAFNGFCHTVLHFCLYDINSKTDEYSRKVLESKAKSALGITVDFKKYKYYNAKNDTVTHGAHGGNWTYAALTSDIVDGASRHTVIIDYYADSAYIVKAKTMKYTVVQNADKSFTLLSTELTYDSGYGVALGSI